MAGGVFTTQNKVRPGAYINFKGINSNIGNTGQRGIVVLGLSLPFGPEHSFIKIKAEDLVNGQSEKLIGLRATDKGAKVIKLALQNAQSVLLYRLNNAGVKATESIGGIKATAKYPGTAGNFISISVKALENNIYQVVTFFNNVQKDVQNIKTKEELKNNDFVEFEVTGNITASVATLLAGGVDGTVGETDKSGYLDAVSSETFNTISSYGMNTDKVVELVKSMRENYGKKVQGIVGTSNNIINYEGIIQTRGQGYKTADMEVSGEEFLVWLAGATAGAGVAESNTYKVIDNAVEIINPVKDEEIIELLNNGYLIITKRRNGEIVIERDINSLITIGENKNSSFQKNRVIRILDEISNYASETFETNFIGKINNDETGRNLFKSNIVQFITNLVNLGAIQNFDSKKDIQVAPGEQTDGMTLYLSIQPIDALEKLYMTVDVR